MATTYTKADRDIVDVADQLLKENYPALAAVELTVEILVAHASRDEHGEIKTPALKLHGWPCYATIKANNLKDRVAGLADVRMVVDGDRWDDLSDERQRAILDHELYHLELKLDEEGGPMSDDVGRPLVKLRPHDFEFGGFAAICSRHGEAAIEHDAYRAWLAAGGDAGPAVHAADEFEAAA